MGQQKESILLTHAFKKLEKDKNIHLAYDPDVCDHYYAKDWNKTQSSSQILSQILNNLPFKYQEQGKDHYLILFDLDKLKLIEAKSKEEQLIQLSGSIIDAYTSEPIIGAIIRIMPDGKIIESDEKGYFSIKTSSQYEQPWIEVRYLGYQTQYISTKKITSKSIKIQLQNDLALLPAITVAGSRPILQMERIQGIQEAKSLSPYFRIQSNVFRDPMRLIQQSAGIDATDDRSSGLQIRGSGTEENLIRLNGLTLFSVDHFYGVFSNINPFIISSIDLYKSYFPAQYGGRSSSVIQLRSLEDYDQWNGGVDLNLITLNTYLYAPLHKKVKLLLGGRTTTLNLGKSDAFSTILQSNNSATDPIFRSDSTEIVALNPDYSFNDFFAKLDITPIRKWTITSSFFHSSDSIHANYNSSRINSNRVFGMYGEVSKWKNQAFNIQTRYAWSDHWNTEFNAAHSQYSFNQNIVSRIQQVNPTSTKIEISRVSNEIDNNNFSLNNIWKRNRSNYYFGIELNQYATEVLQEFDRKRVFRDTVNRWEQAYYLQSEFNLTDKWQLSPGLRVTKYQNRSNTDFSPRFSLTYKWNSIFNSSIHYGIYHQYLRQAKYEDRFGREYYLWTQTDDIKFPILSSQQWEFIQNIRYRSSTIKLELYYKNIEGLIENLIVYETPRDSNIPLNIRSEILNNGKGRYYGVDVTYEQKMGKYEFYVIYSYNKSENSFPRIDNGNYYQKAYARTHQIKSNHLLTFNRWDLALNGVYGSPLPYNDIYYGGTNPRDRQPRKITSKLDDYLRIDFELRHKIKFKKSRIELGLSVLNIFDRANTKYAQTLFNFQDPSKPGSRNDKYIVGAEVESLPRTFNVSLAYHF